MDLTTVSSRWSGICAVGVEQRFRQALCFGSSLSPLSTRRHSLYLHNLTRDITVSCQDALSAERASRVIALSVCSNYELPSHTCFSVQGFPRADVTWAWCRQRGLTRSSRVGSVGSNPTRHVAIISFRSIVLRHTRMRHEQQRHRAAQPAPDTHRIGQVGTSFQPPVRRGRTTVRARFGPVS